MRVFFCLFLALLLTSSAFAQDSVKAKAKAQALLLLEKAARERGQVWRDLPAAIVYAAEANQQAIIWVGEPIPEVMQDFPTAVHVQVRSFQGSNSKRVIVPTDAGFYWQIDAGTPAQRTQQIRRVLDGHQHSSVQTRDITSRLC